VAMFAQWIYFGLEYRTDTHDGNESFALACSNEAPDNATVVAGDIMTYDAVKCVCIDGRSWDLEVVKAESRVRNNTVGNYLAGNNFKVAKNQDNHTIYEFRFYVQSNRTGDIDWLPNNTTVRTVNLFFGNTFLNESYFYYPDIANWKSTGKTGIIVREQPKGGAGQDIEALQLNVLAGQVTTFIIAGCIFGYVGVYIKSTGSRIKRRW
nr:hypothetical protein [Candidatus Sigynarchaeota archaeon]